MHDVKLIAADMDGTFLGHKGETLEANGAAFRKAAAQGIRIAFASGRMLCVLSQLARTLDLPTCHIIGLNGAHVLDEPDGQALEMHPMSEENRAACIEILHRAGCLYNLYTDEGLYTNRVMDEEAERAFRKRFAACPTVAIGPDAHVQAQKHPCIKFFVMGGTGHEQAQAEIRRLCGVELTSASPGTFEIMPEGVHKAGALRKLADRLHISMADVMAFGDYDNDVSMLKACSHSVAMGNSSQAALDAAVYRTLPNTECGVAYAVEEMLQGRLHMLRK